MKVMIVMFWFADTLRHVFGCHYQHTEVPVEPFTEQETDVG